MELLRSAFLMQSFFLVVDFRSGLCCICLPSQPVHLCPCRTANKKSRR